MSHPLLARLAALDIKVRVDGVSLKLDAPRGVLTEDLLGEVRTGKPALIAALSLRCHRYPDSHPRFWRKVSGEVVCDTCHPALPGTPREVAQEVLDRHPGRAGLLDDLRKGSEWLDRAANRPEGIPDAFHVVLSDWTAKEKALRALFGFTGCVLTPARCKPESAVSCLACVPERPAS